jgi:hypothetical protein
MCNADENPSTDTCLLENWGCCVKTAVNGVCSTLHYLCNTGTSTNNVENATTWTWKCQGYNGGTTASCTENRSIDGDCGTTHYNCTSGTAANQRDNTADWTWTWSCSGLNGGTNDTCIEYKDPIPPTIATFNASVSNATVNLSWTAHDNTGGSGINHYGIWISSDGDSFDWIKDVTTTSTTDVPGDGTWWYGLHAIDNAGNDTSESDPGGPGKKQVTLLGKSQLKLV